MPADLWLAAVGMIAAQASAAPPADGVVYANRQQLALAERGPAQGWHVTPAGLRWRRVKGDGTGIHPGPNDEVTAHYVGTLSDGTTFDSSYARNEPITFRPGQVIPGWQQALPLAGVGDVLEVAIPWALAYGIRGKGPIPGGATLLFTIELLAVDAKANVPR
jgi:FKBP-type peptidyl-prolyl cis-trans isomerase